MDRVRDSLYLDDDGPDGQGVRVAVLDSGIDVDHPDLVDRIELSEATCLTRHLEDRSGHGTHIAGIIAGTGAASNGQFRGIAPGASLIGLKVKAAYRGRTDDLVAGVIRAIELGADIINYSGGTRGPLPPPWKWPKRPSALQQVFDTAVDQGILCVCAAGNYGDEGGSIVTPGILESVLTVGSLESGKVVASDSSRGPVYLDDSLPPGGADRLDLGFGEASLPTRPKPDVVVYGRRSGIMRTVGGPISTRSSEADGLIGVDPKDLHALYAPMGGSSQATAVVTGLAALLMEAGQMIGFDWGPNRATAVKRLLLEAAKRVEGADEHAQGHGKLIWPAMLAVLFDCHASLTRWKNVVLGPQLRLEP